MPNTVIDVLIPVYNGATTVESAIESIQKQTHRDLRIHVVDDGSTDATPQILARLAAADERILVHRQQNGGIVAALNFGLGFCTADILARHDADDIAYPNRFEVQLAYLEANPACVAVGCAVRHIDGNGKLTGSIGKLQPPEGADFNWVPSREPYIIHPFLMARRAAIEAVNGYRHVYHCEDTDLYWRLRDVGVLHNLDDVLGEYRLHDGSISGSSLHNGRMMSVSSQLAGLSALRRHAGRADFHFDKDRVARLKKAKTLDEMLAVACADVQPDEREMYELMVGAKMLELSAYRPWELEQGDCAFIRRAFDKAAHRVVDPQNRKSLRANMNGTSARLASEKRYASARALCPPALLPGFLLRYALRVFLPPEARKRIKLWRSGGVPAK